MQRGKAEFVAFVRIEGTTIAAMKERDGRFQRFNS